MTANASRLPFKVEDDSCDVDEVASGDGSGTSSLSLGRVEVEARDEQELEVGGSEEAAEIDDELAEDREMLSANADANEAECDGDREDA